MHQQVKARCLEGALTKNRVFQLFEIEWIDIKNIFNLTVCLDERREKWKFENWNFGSHKIYFSNFPIWNWLFLKYTEIWNLGSHSIKLCNLLARFDSCKLQILSNTSLKDLLTRFDLFLLWMLRVRVFRGKIFKRSQHSACYHLD